MTNLDHLSFGDLLDLANTASSYFRSRQTSWPNNDASSSAGTETSKKLLFNSDDHETDFVEILKKHLLRDLSV